MAASEVRTTAAEETFLIIGPTSAALAKLNEVAIMPIARMKIFILNQSAVDFRKDDATKRERDVVVGRPIQ